MTLNENTIRELLPKENLFGRWAEHPNYGRGIIISAHPDQFNDVWFAYETDVTLSGTDWDGIAPEDLTLDPIELTTKEDYQNAPEGTIVAHNEDYPFVKNGQGDWWDAYHNMYDEKELAGTSRKVLRWGWGEQQ